MCQVVGSVISKIIEPRWTVTENSREEMQNKLSNEAIYRYNHLIGRP